jgi:hypothetical protein
MICQAKGHDVSIVFTELQRGCVFRQSGDVHLKEIDRELTVDVMEFVLVLTIVLCKILFINLLKVAKIIRAFRVDTFMHDKVFAILLGNQGVHAMRTTKLK